MSKSNPKFAGFGFVPRESAMAGPGTLPHRSTGHPSTGRSIRSTGHLSTSRPVELHSSVTGRPVPTETDLKHVGNSVLEA
ncbi:hypothetical protein L484_019686 [Morus notabilis]|uniref:Uncharacterized protein n=1 Tax=Morus notabilis TaxID=981085 RepID=W9QDD7_9ROSA|nr:hypothetical protein L484_019686 [Morus notabilis]